MKPTSSSVQDCPQCGLVNPSTAERCDCGYEFAAGRATRPYGSSNVADLTGVDIAICLLLPLIGLIVGIVRMVQGKPSGAKMAGISLVMSIVFTMLRFMMFSAR